MFWIALVMGVFMQQQEIPFPVELKSSQAELEERYHPVRFVATEDASYHFVVGVPKSWKIARSESQPPDQDEPVRTLLIVHGEDDTEIEVFSVLLDREMHAADWVQVVLEARGHTIIKSRRLPTDFGDAGDFLAEIEDDHGTIISRMFVIKDHNRLFVLHGRTRLNTYPRDADDFLCAMLSMRLLKPTSLISAEPLKEIHIGQPLECRFRVPQTWERQAAPSAEGGVSFQLQDLRDGQVVASVQVTTLLPGEANNASELCKQYLDQLRERGFALEVLGEEEYEPPEGFANAAAYRVGGTHGEAEVEGRCIVLRKREGWLILASLHVAASTQRELWSIHHRAFQIVLQTLACELSGEQP